ncbi:tRNA 2'-phosphotransferase 1-like [Trifolium medium]|uniref:tRNA 2'-phosphotransferase 1-like n=1 Tax=Trifolium medium TaxID=97028 RepID=A0A392MIE0_9FABA|nr:tRNA 2'-phosphotransferase 1-like [Trifolium medium]
MNTEACLGPIRTPSNLSAGRWKPLNVACMRRDVNVLIFLDVRKALEEGMKLYISDNKVILTEGFDGVVPSKYFQKIESWPGRQPIPF